MTTSNHPAQSLVSVIITCYNQANFLVEAIESVLSQTHRNFEIIIVDDGSTDHTSQIALLYPKAKYIFQKNQGLSAARNTGIDNSCGDFIVFLDADDYLYPHALETNLNCFSFNVNYGMVSGWHDKVDEWRYPIETEEQTVISKNHYKELLLGNYIGMHAAVMYPRWVLEKERFDTSLRACEDYDLYFRIARNYHVGSHNSRIAAYRIHGANMSSKIPFMLQHVLKVCERQKSSVRTDAERKAFQQGLRNWKEYYTEKLFRALSRDAEQSAEWPSTSELGMLLKNKPFGLVKYGKRKLKSSIKNSLKSRLPERILKSLHHAGLFSEYTPKPGTVDPGDFQRRTPFSDDFGFDRGGPIDRFYIEQFLERNKESITGTVLEIGDNEYTLRYGRDKVLKSDILHVDSRNPQATYIGDITNVPEIPSDRFDCIIFTQTLHLIYDFKSALNTCYRLLKPGGSLLMTVPGISHIDKGEWKEYWLWSFTDKSIRRLLGEIFNPGGIEIKTYGNVYVASAFLYGMGLPEFKKEYLNFNDPSYQVIISAKATKGS